MLAEMTNSHRNGLLRLTVLVRFLNIEKSYSLVLVQTPQVMPANQHYGQQGNFVGGQQFANPMPAAQQQFPAGMSMSLIICVY